ncbi:hypothetical protein BDV93DRAFT_521870 [Ceratobasidium sp. AG-I]|nr:hypothetical protein BDV93DRAFT_521870 [Ceratobasidium sp. AG-I]
MLQPNKTPLEDLTQPKSGIFLINAAPNRPRSFWRVPSRLDLDGTPNVSVDRPNQSFDCSSSGNPGLLPDRLTSHLNDITKYCFQVHQSLKPPSSFFSRRKCIETQLCNLSLNRSRLGSLSISHGLLFVVPFRVGPHQVRFCTPRNSRRGNTRQSSRVLRFLHHAPRAAQLENDLLVARMPIVLPENTHSRTVLQAQAYGFLATF